MAISKRFLLGLSAALLASVANAGLTGDYFALSGPSNSDFGKHPDVENGVDGGTVTGLVEADLGPDGLPVLSAYGKTYAGPSGPIHDYDTNTNEILWWTPGFPTDGGFVAYDKTIANDTVNYPSNLFPTGQTDDSTWMTAAHWYGTFTAPNGGSASFSVQSDDDAWVYLNGHLVLDNGGVKGIDLSANETVSGLTVGNTYTIDVFFADRHTVQSGIIFNSDVQLNPAPEPASLAALGLGAVALLRRRRK